MRERLTEALAGRYTLEQEIGRGGMAVVFRAHDLRHDRPVALKVMRDDVATLIGTDRFLREIRITARLNHPHILPLLDSGEAGGFLFYVMPFVAGRSLRELLQSEGRLEVGVALRVAGQVAAALDHAHRQGVIHRDVKPENILLSEGLATVADFGVAQAISTVPPQRLTGTGLQLGTFGYMSPEQAAGAATLDERTDVYSLAVVAYEMLVGEPPRHWVTGEAVAMERFLDAVPAHREILDRLHGRIEQALVRGMALSPGDRFASPGALARALEVAAEGAETVSDERMHAIMKRAAELELTRPAETRALSMGGVEQVAAQVGIPPDRVRRAARDLERGEVIAVTKRAGKRKGPTVAVDRVARGEPNATRRVRLVDEIQASLGTGGHVSTFGDKVTWSPAATGIEDRKVVVTLTLRDGETRVHVEERFELAGWRLMIPGMGAFVTIMGVVLVATLLGVNEPPLVALPLGGGAAVLTAVGYLRSRMQRRRPELEELADRLVVLIEETD
ncbi:MAG: serine/threonine-protein kinase [Gemmatimonadota bacterium]|jgi:hypothetical protein